MSPNHKFKPGDLALIVNTVRTPEYIGKTVELVEFQRQGNYYQGPKRERLRAEGDAWLVKGDLSGSFTHMGRITPTPGIALVREKHLMPLRGDFTPEQQKAKEVEPCA